jgi:hypothetical protein
MKECTKCKEPKQLTEFHKSKRNPDGLECNCKACRKKTYQKYWIENKDYINYRNYLKTKP